MTRIWRKNYYSIKNESKRVDIIGGGGGVKKEKNFLNILLVP